MATVDVRSRCSRTRTVVGSRRAEGESERRRTRWKRPEEGFVELERIGRMWIQRIRRERKRWRKT
jgi:hypothetical protein